MRVGMQLQPEPPAMKGEGVDVGCSDSDINHHGNPAATASSSETEKDNESITKLLKKICDHLKNGDQDEEEEKKKKNEWRLAAAVLDRICAIVFTVIFVTATVTFFIIFTEHP